MLTLRRSLGLLLVLLLVLAAWTAWTAWQVKGDLEAAETDARALQRAVRDDDRAAADAAAEDLRDSSSRAAEGVDGLTWSALTHVPLVGDDAAGVRALSRSLDALSREAVTPLLETSRGLDGVTAGGGIDVQALQGITGPVAEAADGLAAAARPLDGLSSDGFVDRIQEPYDEYAALVRNGERAFRAAGTATGLMPGMLGAEGSRDYLMVFQNNAEIRATGGLPGAWAHVTTRNGRITMVEQGSTADFPELDRPVLPLSDAETRVYGEQLGTYFHDANFTPDFPRAAQLWAARFEQERSTPLDGVIALDTVALSYLLEGTGSVSADGVTVTPDNVVDELLNRTYFELEDPARQDARFQAMALAVFQAVTGEPESPMRLAQGLGRAGREGRLLVHSFRDAEQERLSGTTVGGALETEATEDPVVDVSLNDATGAKMSYYLRYDVDVRPEGCSDGRQTLVGSMRLGSTISAEEAEELPGYVSGRGIYGTEPGSQLVLARVHGPVGGDISDLRFDGEPIETDAVELDGRPVITVAANITPTDNVDITWRMTTGEGQTGDGSVGVTPSVVSGDADTTFDSGCE